MVLQRLDLGGLHPLVHLPEDTPQDRHGLVVNGSIAWAFRVFDIHCHEPALLVNGRMPPGGFQIVTIHRPPSLDGGYLKAQQKPFISRRCRFKTRSNGLLLSFS